VKYPTQGCENLTGAQGGDRVSAQALLEVHRPSDAGAARWAGPHRALSLGPSRRWPLARNGMQACLKIEWELKSRESSTRQ